MKLGETRTSPDFTIKKNTHTHTKRTHSAIRLCRHATVEKEKKNNKSGREIDRNRLIGCNRIIIQRAGGLSVRGSLDIHWLWVGGWVGVGRNIQRRKRRFVKRAAGFVNGTQPSGGGGGGGGQRVAAAVERRAGAKQNKTSAKWKQQPLGASPFPLAPPL